MFSTPWAIAVLIVTTSYSSCGYNLHFASLYFRRSPSDDPYRSSSRSRCRSLPIGGPDRYAAVWMAPPPFHETSCESSGVIPVSTVQSRSKSIVVPLQLVLGACSLSALSYVSMRVPRADADEGIPDGSNTITSEATRLLMSDEFELIVDSEPIGLGLVATEYKQFGRIVVKSIKEYAPENVKSRVREGMVLIGIDGMSIEGSSTLEEVYLQIKNAAKPIRLMFRDPLLFYQLVQGDADTAQNSSAGMQGRVLYTTSLLPRKGLFPQQILSVERISPRRVAVDRCVHTGDTVEVLYQVRVGKSPLLLPLYATTQGGEELQLSPTSSAVLDGASDATMAAAGGDYREVYASSIFFVVGNQSPNKYNFFSSSSSDTGPDSSSPAMGDFLQVLPASWDSLLVGMGCNEVRVIGMPPCFYRSKAIAKELERYRLLLLQEEDSYLQLAVKCLSINGVA